MDSLALLCNLYADGPTSLARLRAAGCTSLAALDELAPEDLVELLGASPAAAHRFLEEARQLVTRGLHVLEAEEPVADAPADTELPAARPAGHPLVAGAVDGLDEHGLHALRAVGVETLEALADGDPLDWSQRSGLGFTRLRRWQFLADRRLQDRARLEPERARGADGSRRAAGDLLVPYAASRPKLSPRDAPREAAGNGSAGPFDLDREVGPGPSGPFA